MNGNGIVSLTYQILTWQQQGLVGLGVAGYVDDLSVLIGRSNNAMSLESKCKFKLSALAWVEMEKLVWQNCNT